MAFATVAAVTLAQIPGGLIGLVVLFLVLALAAYLLGARGVAGFSMDIAKVLIILFVVLAVISLLWSLIG